MSVIEIFRQPSGNHERRLVLVGDEMDTSGLGQAQVDNDSLESFRIDSRSLPHLQVHLD
jgi:hypothetical protein